MNGSIGETQWQRFQEDGYLRLGEVAPREVSDLAQRLDDIMLGRADIAYDELMMQLDRRSVTETEPGPQTNGHKGATLAYRKIQHLEIDPLFLSYMRRPIFRDACARMYGGSTDVRCFRAMFMNKPAGRGSELRWHQDRWANLDRDPLLTVWTALDAATIGNGCLRVIAGSHHQLLNPGDDSGFLTDQMVEQLDQADVTFLEMQTGEVVLLHNHTVHSSGVNRTAHPRRAFSACYMHGSTRARDGEHFAKLFDGRPQPSRDDTSRVGAVT